MRKVDARCEGKIQGQRKGNSEATQERLKVSDVPTIEVAAWGCKIAHVDFRALS
jgi:hypothetical protein